jgi:hypothetical protein
MSEEIIAYRIGESLYCPDCYEKAAKTLKAVQHPEDPQVTFPVKPIKVGDISVFICNECKIIKGVYRFSEEIVEIPERKSLIDLEDMMEEGISKIAFLGDFFNQGRPDDELFSERGMVGFHHILRDVQDNLIFVVNEINRRNQKGLIIEKTE